MFIEHMVAYCCLRCIGILIPAAYLRYHPTIDLAGYLTVVTFQKIIKCRDALHAP